VVEWAEELLGEKNNEIEKAKEEQQLYIDRGAVPEELEYTPPVAPGEPEVDEEPEGERTSAPPLQSLDQNLEREDEVTPGGSP